MSASALPSDLLLLVLNRLETIDSIRFGAVCRCWRHTFLLFRTTKQAKSSIPWLMFSRFSLPEFCFFFSFGERKIFRMHLPQLIGHKIVGSSRGFLISADRNADLHVFNPLTGACILLPPTATIPSVPTVVRCPDLGHITHYRVRNHRLMFLTVSDMQETYYTRAIVSPCLRAVVVRCCCWPSQLAFARHGDKSWTALSPVDESSISAYNYRLFNYSLQDFLFRDGKLYAVDRCGALFVFDLGAQQFGPPVVLTENRPLNVPVYSDCDPKDNHLLPIRRYLAESPDGDVLLVSRDRRRLKTPLTTASFKVFRLEHDGNSGKYKWEEMKSLGENALFLGYNQSVCLPVRRPNDSADVPRGDVIYYGDDFNTFGNRELEMGVFSLAEGRIARIVASDLGLDHCKSLQCPPPLWFSPSLF